MGFCLCSEHSLCLISVAVAFAVLLVRVLYRDVLVHEVLVMHVGDCVVGGLEVRVGYEAVAFGEIGFVASDLERCQWADVRRGERTDLGLSNKRAEAAEGVIEHPLVNHGIKVADKEFSPDFD